MGALDTQELNAGEAYVKAKGLIEGALKTEKDPETQRHLENLSKQLEEQKNSTNGQEILAAQRALESVKQQLQALSGHSKAAAEALARISSLSINTIEDAKNAADQIKSAEQTEQAAAGKEVQEALGGLLTGVGAAFGALVGKETMGQISKWNRQGLEAVEYAFAALGTQDIQNGIFKLADNKASKDRDLV